MSPLRTFFHPLAIAPLVALTTALLVAACSAPPSEPLRDHPVPFLRSASPFVVAAGSPGSTITLSGNLFLGSSQARWNGADRVTRVIDDTRLEVDLTAGDVATAGIGGIVVVNPPPGGGTSASLTMTIVNPTPRITSIDPAVIVESGVDTTVRVLGTGFVSGTRVRWIGLLLSTTVTSSTELRAIVPAHVLRNTGPAYVVVETPSPGGGTSNTVYVDVRSP